MSTAAPHTAAGRSTGAATAGRRARTALAALGVAALLGTTACGAEDSTEGAGQSPAQTEVSADASAAPESASASEGTTGEPTGEGAESSAEAPSTSAASAPAEGEQPEDPDDIVASVPGNYRGTDSTTLAPGEAERVLPGMRAAVVPAADLPGGVVTAERIQEMPDVPFSQPLPLDGVEPTGECRDLVRRIDEATVPHTVLLHTGYEVDPGSARVLAPEASVGSFLVYTPSTTDLVGPYGALPETCGTLTGGDGTEVEFAAVDGVPGAVLVSSSGPRGESVVTLGGASAGHRHLSATFVQVEPETAAEMLRAQVEAFRAAE